MYIPVNFMYVQTPLCHLLPEGGEHLPKRAGELYMTN